MCAQEPQFTTSQAKRILEELGVLNTDKSPISRRMVEVLFDFSHTKKSVHYWTKKAEYDLLAREIGSSGWKLNHGSSTRNSIYENAEMYFA